MEWNDPFSYVICGRKESINFPQNDHHDKMGLTKALTLCDFQNNGGKSTEMFA